MEQNETNFKSMKKKKNQVLTLKKLIDLKISVLILNKK